MKKLLIVALIVPLFLISCGKSEEVKTVANPPVVEKQVVATGNVVENNTGKIEEVSTGANSGNWSKQKEAFIKESSLVYWVDNLWEKNKINNADVSTFIILSNGYNRDYAKDKNRVYVVVDKYHMYDLNILENADPLTFQVLKDIFSKDKNNVYMKGTIIKWADPKTFTEIDWGYSKDKNNVYLFGTIIDGADPITFERLDEITSQDKDYTYTFTSQWPDQNEVKKTKRNK